ncbi:MAG: DUF1156 domain-containing protein, partial [Pseudobdellovibrionaceae bacterium]
MNPPLRIPRKLIEVALPLDAINIAAAKEKQPGIGAHPRGLHLWWARRPLAAARAVIFAQMVNDPGYERHLGRGLSKDKAQVERERLFRIIERLVQWDNLHDEEVAKEAQDEILKSWQEVCFMNKDHPLAAKLFNPSKLPSFHDPFAGGGAIPLEAQRLGLEVLASDLNPVSVLINKSMIEFPAMFAGSEPVGPINEEERERSLIYEWTGAKGLAEDIRRYGHWIRKEALKKCGQIYPSIEVTPSEAKERPDLVGLVGKKLNVLTWIWARTVKSPNPAFSHVDVPLASTFILASKEGRTFYAEPVIDGDQYEFKIRSGVAPERLENGTKLARGANFQCLLSGSPIEPEYIKAQGQAGRMGIRLLAIVAEGPRGKFYLNPTADHEAVAKKFKPKWKPTTLLPDDPRNFWTINYGLTTFGDLFTDRQLVALNMFSDLVQEAIVKCREDAAKGGMRSDDISLVNGGKGAKAYAEAVGTYLAFAISRLADYGSSIATWKPSGEQVMQTFKRQSLPMTWDFPESNFFGTKAICWSNAVEYSAENLEVTFLKGTRPIGKAIQAD